ncbi:MAG: efflux RND transporter permease subunit [Clostridiales bacterium]|nr:efflux RND transporter permease subunit [Clostridiales bacterium]
MIGLTKFSLRRPVTIILTLITIAYFGIQGLMSSKVELIPEMELPYLIAYTVYGGASPEDINELILLDQEEAVSSLDNVDTVYTYSMENMGILMISYEYGTNIDTAYINLKKALDQIADDLPDDADQPIIMELDINSAAVITLAVSGEVDGNLYTYVDNNIVPELEKLSAVGEVSIAGGQESYIKIELIPEKLEQYGLSMTTVATLIGAADFTIPAGDIDVGSKAYDVSVGNDFESAERLKDAILPLSNGDTIHLSDIANVYDALEEADSIGRYNGEDVVSISIKKQQSSTAIETSEQVTAQIAELLEEYPGLDIVVVNDSSDLIRESITNVFQTMIMAIILSMIILWLFYGDLRASVIVGTSIPISIMLALICMNAAGFTLNVISLTSLVLGVGMMVDNSINVLDGCFRAREKGLDFYHAAIEGTHTMIGSIFGGTATTCVVFLPLAFMSGLVGQLFTQLGYTIVFSLVASFFSAIVIVPLCFLNWHPQEKDTAPVDAPLKVFQKWYRNVMPKLIPKTGIVFGIVALLLVASFAMASRLDISLMVTPDEGIVDATINVEPGLTIEAVNEAIAEVEEMIASEEDVDHYLLTYGSSGLSISIGDTVDISAYLKDDRKLSTDEVIEKWRYQAESMTNITATFEQGSTSMSSSMSSNSDEIEIDLQSTNYDALKEASNDLVAHLREREDILQVHSSIENGAPVIKVEVDPVMAEAEGLTPYSIGSLIYMNLSSTNVMTIRVDNETIDVNVEFADDQYNSIEQLQGMMITTATGTTLPLEDLADIYYEDSPQMIQRMDKQYQVAITMQPQADYKRTAEDNVKKYVQNEWDMPSGIEMSQNANDEMIAEEIGALVGALITGIFLVFIVMGIQFESPKYSLMVMATIPFALIGSFGLLFLADSPISMVSTLGFLMLIGTVVNNGILYVDTVNQMLAEHVPLDQALVDAGVLRTRPILMTTLTTVISMLPNAFAFGRAGAMMQGLALVDVGGLTASTILTLFLLPTFYRFVHHAGRKKQKEWEQWEID